VGCDDKNNVSTKMMLPHNCGGLDSIPESNPIRQSGKGDMSIKNRLYNFSQLLNRVLRAMGYTLARMLRLCYRIESRGFGISLIPGFLTWNINLRAGGSGRAHHLYRSSVFCPNTVLIFN
jgi:hypothetical protein